MEDSFERIIFPTIEEICEVNHSLITTTGGAFYPPFNLQNPSGLTWALDCIQSPFLFGNNIYPTLSDKTALLTWTIINDHVFFDGNKRTGMALIRIIHIDNNILFSAVDHELVETARDIINYRASGFTKQRLSQWIEEIKIR